jgi:hypothetical protein
LKADLDPSALETPTLKGDVFTTGRGGSGNMARTTDSKEKRRAQDVVGWVSISSFAVYTSGSSKIFEWNLYTLYLNWGEISANLTERNLGI